LNGVFNLADASATTAKLDLTAAFNDAAGRAGAVTIPTELGGTTLPPGIYKSAAGTFGITGTVTLDGQNNPNSVFIFQTASTLITASNSSVVLVNGAQANNVFWQVGSSATLGTYSIFKGNILAQASITATTGATIDGRALTQSAAVTLDTNTFNAAVAVVPPAAPVTVTGTHAADVTPTITGGGAINVQNNGGHVAATVTGTGAINITNNGAAVTVTENGAGTFNILNNGQILTATNTGNGVITINSTCTGAVTVNNTGNGNITVNATGTTPITLTYTDGLNHTYP